MKTPFTKEQHEELAAELARVHAIVHALYWKRLRRHYYAGESVGRAVHNLFDTLIGLMSALQQAHAQETGHGRYDMGVVQYDHLAAERLAEKRRDPTTRAAQGSSPARQSDGRMPRNRRNAVARRPPCGHA